jgi:uncharacterized Tic20 family protein
MVGIEDTSTQVLYEPALSEGKRKEAMMIHIKALGLPLFGMMGGPLIFRTRITNIDPYLKKHWVATFNFQLTLASYGAGVFALAVIVGAPLYQFSRNDWFVTWFIPSLLVAVGALIVFWLLMTIRAAFRARCGIEPPYPRMPLGVHQETWND